MGISTSTLAKKHNIQSKVLFEELHSKGLITRQDESWTPTETGIKAGAKVVNSSRYGDYIEWPDDFDILSIEEASDNSNSQTEGALLSSTEIGKKFGFSANKVNFVLSELGWIQKGVKGWVITESGKRQGGVQEKSYRSGFPYVKWPSSLLESKALTNSVDSLTGDGIEKSPVETSTDEIGFREKFEAKHRTTDGHYVRSKAEMLIDNFLYMLEIPHAYERRLPIEEEVYCDFYIPTGKVYIEYWGYENNPKYLARKKEKQAIYKKYNLNLIELSEKEVQNLDDHLPRLLIDFGIQTY
jgi:hypothetical protein